MSPAASAACSAAATDDTSIALHVRARVDPPISVDCGWFGVGLGGSTHPVSVCGTNEQMMHTCLKPIGWWMGDRSFPVNRLRQQLLPIDRCHGHGTAA